ncbi:MAG: hypothetical protein ACJZ81_03360 [Paracoccaceae bacterium]
MRRPRIKQETLDQEVLFGGLEEKLKELASLAQTEADGETKGSSKETWYWSGG